MRYIVRKTNHERTKLTPMRLAKKIVKWTNALQRYSPIQDESEIHLFHGSDSITDDPPYHNGKLALYGNFKVLDNDWFIIELATSRPDWHVRRTLIHEWVHAEQQRDGRVPRHDKWFHERFAILLKYLP